MGRIVVMGGGVCGLVAALMLSRDGHDVVVLERDEAEPPDSVDDVWNRWTRAGVAQFRQPHTLHALSRHILAEHLPDVLEDLAAAGALRIDPVAALPGSITDREPREGDDRFWSYTGRRPLVEAVVARAAIREPGVRVVRGARVTGLVAGTEVIPGVPHVVGVQTHGHGSFKADVVVDALGRRSTVPQWLASLGGRPPLEEADDCGFTYYSRYFRSDDESVPQVRAPIQSNISTLTVLTLPADNGHWSVTLTTTSDDRPLKALRHTEVWTRVLAACPLHAHWLEGQPVTDVLPMSGVLDRYRRFVVDGMPIVTGLLAVADAWACTNPSAGRGISIGLAHCARLRDVVRKHGGAPKELAEAWDDTTERELTPWYRMQLLMDRARLSEVRAIRDGAETPPRDDAGRLFAAVTTAMLYDADIFRAAMELVTCLALPAEIFARDGLLDRIRSIAADKPPMSLPGPSREELLALVAGAG